ncbi:hypothetical protein KDA_76780 [Dictyobacter alpinus]|uniref:Uncharacterized protein n=1 Tax=Dictyobacter alpinus TaxID=2014873 RepID=A0A402BLH4_9CHLR|nr:hypothetical protein [Dictyobacter alpinus]GCE32194.1 hypothetical protein KDA_76780 [Dictyobacter alpinus]
MRYCVCGKVIARRKGHGGREREYCSDRCRQQACRARHKDDRTAEKRQQRIDEIIYTTVFQDVHKTTWQVELELQAWLITNQQEQIEKLTEQLDATHHEIDIFKLELGIERSQQSRLKDHLADKEAEIVRLTALLDFQSRRKH